MDLISIENEFFFLFIFKDCSLFCFWIDVSDLTGLILRVLGTQVDLRPSESKICGIIPLFFDLCVQVWLWLSGMICQRRWSEKKRKPERSSTLNHLDGQDFGSLKDPNLRLEWLSHALGKFPSLIPTQTKFMCLLGTLYSYPRCRQLKLGDMENMRVGLRILDWIVLVSLWAFVWAKLCLFI